SSSRRLELDRTFVPSRLALGAYGQQIDRDDRLGVDRTCRRGAACGAGLEAVRALPVRPSQAGSWSTAGSPQSVESAGSRSTETIVSGLMNLPPKNGHSPPSCVRSATTACPRAAALSALSVSPAVIRSPLVSRIAIL